MAIAPELPRHRGSHGFPRVARSVVARSHRYASVRAWWSLAPRSISAQLVDDLVGRRCVRSTMEADFRTIEGDKTPRPARSRLVAERAKSAGVDGVVFDRAGNKYHAVSPPADGAREGGLTF